MSTNDDSASRRGRRADQGESAWRNPSRPHRDEGWDQQSSQSRDNGKPHSEQRGRENPIHQAAFSGFSRAPQPQPRQEPVLPQPPRYQEAPLPPQGYYPEPQQRAEVPRYAEQAPPPYVPPLPPAYDHQPPANYGDLGRDDLFGRESSAHNYDHNPYGQASGYRPEPYEPASRPAMAQPAAPRRDEQDYYREAPSPAADYERGFAPRIASQDAGASRFFLPEERSQASQQRPGAPQAPLDRGYAPAQNYESGGYDAHGGQPSYEPQERFDPRYAGQETWAGEELPYNAGGERGAHQAHEAHGDELDEDFFGDEDDYEHEDLHTAPKRGRRKLIVAAAAAALLAGGGAYFLRSPGGGDKATPFIRADNRPAKEIPGNPGGRQFPNGEKAIYERLRPDGTTQVAAFAPAAAPVTPAFGSPAVSGNSLEDRIDEALKRAQRTGDAPAAQPSRPGPDQPTVVRSEVYRPDGTRVDSGRPTITPNIANVSNGLPYPFGNAPSTAPAPFRTASGPAAAPPQFATAAVAPAPAPVTPAPVTRVASHQAAAVPAVSAPGFYVSLRSAPDEKAIQRDLTALTEKYKSVLGDVQLGTKIADLGAKGVTYRAVAGPLGTRQEAMDLCQKIKGVGGDKACFVTN